MHLGAIFIIIKSLGKAEVLFICVASLVFSENPPKFHQKSQIYRTLLTGGLAKRSAKIKITPIPNSSLIPCFDMQISPLLIAAYDGEISFFQQIKEKTSDPNNTSAQSEMLPIHLAANRGHIELLQDSKNKNHYGKYGVTPLHFAALAGHLEVFKLFHANAVVKNPKMTRSQNEATPFHLAAERGHLKIFEFIIEKEVD